MANERWDGIYGGKNKRYKHTTRKSPKIAQKTDHSIVIFSIFSRYVIFWVVPGESSCQEGSEYVWQRGVGVFKAELRESMSFPSQGTLILAHKNSRF